MARGDSQDHSIDELLKDVPRVETSDERVSRVTQRDWTQNLATLLEKTLNRQLEISREMMTLARAIAADENGRSATAILRTMCEHIEKMRAASHIHESVLFVLGEIRDINYDIRGELRGIGGEIRTTNGLLETLTTLLANGHAH